MQDQTPTADSTETTTTEQDAPAIEPRFFMKNNPARPIVVGEVELHFIFCDFVAGTWRGVFKDETNAIPDEHIYHKADNKSGAAIAISKDKYLQMLQKKRPSGTTPLAVGEYKEPHQKSADTAAADTTATEDEVDPALIDAVGSPEAPKLESVVTNFDKLAEATGVSADTLKDYAKRDEAPKRSTKGHNVAAWIEYCANTQPAK